MMLPFLKCSDSEDHSLRLWTVTEMDLNCCLQKKRFQGPRMTSTCVRAKTQNALKRLDLVPTKWFLISCPLSRMGNQRPLMQTLHDLMGEILKLFWHFLAFHFANMFFTFSITSIFRRNVNSRRNSLVFWFFLAKERSDLFLRNQFPFFNGLGFIFMTVLNSGQSPINQNEIKWIDKHRIQVVHSSHRAFAQ